LNILKLGLESGYQGNILAIFKEAMNVFGTGSANDEDDEDEIVELDEDDGDDDDDDDADKPT
jgi:ribulose-5-phosphate 4-epimerase/fuculose-1-phosphate aldolase